MSEETGLNVIFIPGFYEEVTYRIDDFINRDVVLFLAETNSESIIRENEIAEHRWLSAEKAKALLYPEYSLIIDKVEEIFK
ncbi:MAG: hypothetical protein PHV32_01890 [Eubacteriales bacterium]|nr:hypothetical protein [Eubacteriales bacterium]